jgi:hypothetical protein
MPGTVELPSLQASGSVENTSQWEFDNVPSEREIDEKEWARENGLLEDDDRQDLPRGLSGMVRRKFNLRVAGS